MGHTGYDPYRASGSQHDDPTLEKAQKIAGGVCNVSGGEGFYVQNNLLYRHWNLKKGGGTIEQLVLPAKCRDAALAIAHEIPMGGHLGKTKTAQRLLQPFYWPTLHRDIANYCRGCKACQLDSSRRVQKASLIPLPIVQEPFPAHCNGHCWATPEDTERETICPGRMRLRYSLPGGRGIEVNRSPTYRRGISSDLLASGNTRGNPNRSGGKFYVAVTEGGVQVPPN